MRRPKPLVATLCVACFLLSPGRVDGQSFGDSSLTSAVNTYLDAEAPKEPSEALERLLAGAAAGARVAFALECRRQLNQLLQEQLQMEPGSDRYRRIEDRMDRLQSAASAAAGDFRALRATGARTQTPTQSAPPTASRAAAPPDSEEEQNLEEQLRSFRARVESLMEKHRTGRSQLISEEDAAKQGRESVRYYSRLIEEEIAGITNRRRDLEGLAQAAAAGERDARANAARAAERARATVKEMESAQALAAACNTAEGASRLGASLDNVRREFGAVLAELGNALRAAELHESSAAGYDLWIPEYQLVLSRFPELKDRALQKVKAFAVAVDAIPGSAAKVDELKSVADTLVKDLAGAYEYYRKVNSSRAMEFELLRRRVGNLNFYTTPFKNSHARLKDGPATERARVSGYDLPPSVTRSDVTPCPKAEDLMSVVEQAEREVDLLKLLMVEEDRLRAVAANCGQAKPLTLLGETFDTGASPPANPPAAAVKPPAPAPPATPENGLQILGLNRMTPGQHDRFTAADGFEQPYNSPVEWNSSVEDVVAIDRQTGDAVAFKPGKTVIIARRGDSAAYFNVTVDAVVSNLQGLALAQAQSLAAQDGLQVQRGASAGAPPTSEQAGRIARQDRAPGSRAPAGTVIRVDVYDGAVAAQNPAAAPIDEPGGFESLGGETREVQPPQPVENADGRVPGNASEIVDDFFRGETAPSGETVQEPARPQEDPFAQERAEEAHRAERQRQERENAMMNLLGVMAGASQQMNDIRNRQSGQARPAVTTPPVQSTWPNAGSPPVYNPPGGNPSSSSPPGRVTAPGASAGSPSAGTANACRNFPGDWRPRRSWTKQNGRMVETTGHGRYSVLGNWQNTSCDLNTSWEAIQEFECVKTGELRCQGIARK